MNIVNCAMLGAFILSMPRRPNVERLTDYYAKAMMTGPMKWFCKKSGKSQFMPKDIQAMKATAALKAAERNPYSWNMVFYEYPDGSGYEGRFTKCGICTMMRELGLYDLTPAMCHLDYTMSEAGGASDFVREHTPPPAGLIATAGITNGGLTIKSEVTTVKNQYKNTEGLQMILVGCPIADFVQKNGYMDLMPAMCNPDFDNMPELGIHLIRPKTVGMGYPVCDYRFAGDKSPETKWYERVTDERGFLVSRRKSANWGD